MYTVFLYIMTRNSMKHMKTGLVNFFQYGISAVETELGKCKTIHMGDKVC